MQVMFMRLMFCQMLLKKLLKDQETDSHETLASMKRLQQSMIYLENPVA